MALGDPYVSLEAMREYLKVPAGKGADQESAIESAVASATDEIELYTQRQFNKADTATTRTYQPDSPFSIPVDDFWTTDGLLVTLPDGGILDPNDEDFPAYLDLLPRNGVMDGQPGWPFSEIRQQSRRFAMPYGGRRFSSASTLVMVTAKWGWPAVPSSIIQATKILAAQNYRLADAPLGVTGLEGKFGGVAHVRSIPQVAAKLDRYVVTPILIG